MIWMATVAALYVLILVSILVLGVAFAPALLTYELYVPLMMAAHRRKWFRAKRALDLLADLIVQGNCMLVGYHLGNVVVGAVLRWLLLE